MKFVFYKKQINILMLRPINSNKFMEWVVPPKFTLVSNMFSGPAIVDILL